MHFSNNLEEPFMAHYPVCSCNTQQRGVSKWYKITAGGHGHIFSPELTQHSNCNVNFLQKLHHHFCKTSFSVAEALSALGSWASVPAKIKCSGGWL